MQIDITSLDVGQNFWQTYPEFKVVEPFKSLFQGDKSKDKDSSSRMCWFLVLCYHPSSLYSKLPKEGDEGVHKLVGEDYLEDNRYYEKNRKLLDPLIVQLLELTTSPMQRQLLELENMLEKRRQFLKDADYGLDNFKDLDAMFKSTQAVYDAFSTIQMKIAQEQEGGAARGDKELSLSDKKEI